VRLAVAVATVALVATTAQRWQSGRVQWWTADGRMAVRPVLAADRELVQAAAALLAEPA
jgi:hypothetical protein